MRYSGWGLVLARAGWLGAVVATLLLCVAGIIPAYQHSVTIGLATDLPYLWQLSATDARSLAGFGVSLSAFTIYHIGVMTAFAASFFVVAIFIFARKSHEGIGLLISFTLVMLGANRMWWSLDALYKAQPAFTLPVELIVASGFPCLILFLFFFPDGRAVPSWMHWPAILGSFVDLIFDFVSGTSLGGWRGLISGTWLGGLGTLFAVTMVFTGVGAQVYRYWKISSEPERRQTKWVVLGLSGALALIMLFVALDTAFPTFGAPGALGYFFVKPLISGVMLLIPVTISLAIFRYRLWDIDLILNRLLVFLLLTVSVGAIYVLLVGGLSAFFQTQGSLAISLAATAVVAVLFHPLQSRLQRMINRFVYGESDDPYGVLVRLGQRLGATLAPQTVLPTIVESVAQALKLPYAAIALQRDGAMATVAAYSPVGRRTKNARVADLPAPPDRLVTFPLVYQGEPVGQLLLAPRRGESSFRTADLRLLDDLAHQAGIAAHAQLLASDLQRARERLVTAREEERRRLRRDLHDGLGPALASQALTLDTACLLLERTPSDPEAATALLREVKAQSQAALTDIRRLVYALRPPALDDLGLVGALRELAVQANRPDLQVTVNPLRVLPPLSAAVEVAVYRIVGEALTNVVRHAGARRCGITLDLITNSNLQEGCVLEIRVVDDGCGLDPGRRAGVGLASMLERAEELGGRCHVEKTPGGGTCVTAILPMGGDEAREGAWT